MIMPYLVGIIEQTTELKLLDIRFGYKQKQVVAFFEKIGSLGRRNYLLSAFFIDMLYAAVYTSFFIVFQSYIFNKAFSKTYEFRLLNIVPLFIFIMDVSENLCVGSLLLQYPNINSNLVSLASNATLLKWGGVLFNVLLCFIGLFNILFKSLLLRKK